MRLRPLVLALLVPAIALGAPKSKSKGKGTAKPDTSKSDAGSAAGSAADDTKPDSKPADSPSVAPSTAQLTAPATPAGGGGAAAGSGAGGGSGEPAGEDKGSGAAAGEPDVDSLRQEYLSLRDELFKSRARANAVASALYSTRITVKFTWTSARYYGVSKASVRLDGATVYEDATGAIAGDDGVRFDGYIAPGKHLVTFHVEATGKDDDSFTSTTESQVVVKAIANKDLLVSARGKDGGDIAYEWKRKERGNYGLGIDVAVKTIAQVGGGSAPAAAPVPAKAKK